MKESLWGYYLALLGIGISLVMIFMSNMTTTNQQDYYLLKEVANAAMIDSIDYGYYNIYGEMKINTEKFVENFIRRFSEGISKINTYKIDFYSIYENPPSASIKVTSKTGEYNILGTSTSVDVVNSIDVVLESNNRIVSSHVYYALPYASCDKNELKDKDDYCKLSGVSNLDSEVYYYYAKQDIKEKIEAQGKVFDESKVKILNIEVLGPMKDKNDYDDYLNNFYYEYVIADGTTITELRSSTIHDIPHPILDTLEENLSNYFATDIKDYSISFREIGGETKIFRSVKFKCKDDATFGLTTDTEFVKQYRRKVDESKLNICSTCYYNSKGYNSGISNVLFSPQIRISSYDYYYGIADNANTGKYYISEDEYLAKSEDEKEKYDSTPYYNSCLVGIKYKIDYYYDES
ncbi:MAG: hypothetical protein IJD92_00240 [Bacilli bacterium]|nr:hypothetical protein [Bacilli bacterium]